MFRLIITNSIIRIFSIIIECIKSINLFTKIGNKYENQDRYFELAEREYIEYKEFKHDYINILATLSAYIDDKDFEGLENYFIMI